MPYTFNSVNTGAGGGYVDGIVFNKTEKDLIYARTDVGGAYRWDKINNSWIPITDMVGWNDFNKYGVDALATDPVDPNRVYLATGLYTNSWDEQPGSIMRSTDRGNTWQTTTLPFKVGGNMPGRGMGERLMVDPNKNNILFFGARSGKGLWKSTDYGATWSQVTSFPNVGGYRLTGAADPYGFGNDIIGLSWITFDKASGTPGNPTPTSMSAWRIKQRVYTKVRTAERPGRRYRGSRRALFRTMASLPQTATCTSRIATIRGLMPAQRAMSGS